MYFTQFDILNSQFVCIKLKDLSTYFLNAVPKEFWLIFVGRSWNFVLFAFSVSHKKEIKKRKETTYYNVYTHVGMSP
jgi:hypothetical protein